MNLFNSIYHLGFRLGWRYWQLNRFYLKNPEQLPDLIWAMRFKAVLEPELPWNQIANDFQKSLDSWNKKNDNKA